MQLPHGDPMTMQYTITTKIRKHGKGYAVVDEISFGSGTRKLIIRFKGCRVDCEKEAEKLGKYWKTALSKRSLA